VTERIDGPTLDEVQVALTGVIQTYDPLPRTMMCGGRAVTGINRASAASSRSCSET